MSLFLYIVWGSVLTSLIYMRLSSFSNTNCWRDCLFSILYSCFVCCRGVWVCFWVLCSVPLIYMSVFVPIPCCFDYCSFEYSLKSGTVIPPALFLFLKIALGIQGLLWFHINFRIICSTCMKNVMGILIGIALNL